MKGKMFKTEKCENSQTVIYESLDGAEITENVMKHIETCEECSNVYRELKVLHNNALLYERETPPENLTLKVMNQIEALPAFSCSQTHNARLWNSPFIKIYGAVLSILFVLAPWGLPVANELLEYSITQSTIKATIATNALLASVPWPSQVSESFQEFHSNLTFNGTFAADAMGWLLDLWNEATTSMPETHSTLLLTVFIVAITNIYLIGQSKNPRVFNKERTGVYGFL